MYNNLVARTDRTGFSPFPAYGGNDNFFLHMQQQAQNCTWQNYGAFFQQNRQQIQERCHGRDPQGYRTDRNGCRWENHRPAQTQVLAQTGTAATIQAGNNKLTFNKADQSLRIQNADGTEQNVDLKFWGDPHVNQNGHELGTIKKDLQITLKDGTEVGLLMGDGNGGRPRPGMPTLLDTVAVRSPDGTGALVTGISGPGKLGVTPLDSSLSSEFMAQRAMNKFGNYEPSHVGLDRLGNMVDQTNGQVVYDQKGLDRLDAEQGSRAAAEAAWRQRMVPRHMADDYDRPFEHYTPDMRQTCVDEMQDMFRQLMKTMRHMPGVEGFGMPFARYATAELRNLSMRAGISA